MTKDKIQIKAIAHLARLTIDEKNMEMTATTMKQILALADKMQEIDTHDVQAMSHPLDTVQRLRADQVTESNQREQLLKCAPVTEQGLFLVPQVIE